MKTSKKLLLFALSAVLALGAFAFASCGETDNPGGDNPGGNPGIDNSGGNVTPDPEPEIIPAKVVNTYIGTFAGALSLPDYGMEQAAMDNYVIDTYDDNTYAMTLVKYMDMYGTPGSVTIQTTGSYTEGENEDGDVIVTLSDAQSIVYTTCGMFVMQYSWNTALPDTVFPVEFLGSTSAHNTLEDLQEGFGKGFTFLVAENTKDGQNNCLIAEILEEAEGFKGEAKAHEFTTNATNVYIGTFAGALSLPDYGMEQAAMDNYVITTNDDNTYTMTLVKYMDMYGTPGSVTIQTTGSYTEDENEDGDVIITLKDAESIVYTTCGMFVMQYSWNSDLPETEFPVEFLGSTSAHNTVDDLKEGFGKGFTFLVAENTKDGQNNCLIAEIMTEDAE